ncbi:S1/P1 nuclease [Pseudohongiella nitratireducens]|nr:S1/P1 nuclease [Pseudohongiella nitratireducens]
MFAHLTPRPSPARCQYQACFLKALPALCIMALTFLLSAPAHSWDALGHERSAALVFDQLTEQEQDYWVAVLRHHPRFAEDFLSAMPERLRDADNKDQQRWLFARAGYWPDIARGIPDAARAQFNHPNWHWIDGRWVRADVPLQGNVYLDGTFLPDINGPSDSRIRESRLSDNVLTALITSESILKQPLDSANAQQQAELAIALCWYLHLGADIHQPLHAGASYHGTHFPEGDRGGNMVRLATRGNLHSLWDQALRGSSWEQLLSVFEQLDPQPSAQGFIPGTWLLESREFLHADVYTAPIKNQVLETPANTDEVTVSIEDDYRNRMQEISLQRVALSAARLAGALKAMGLP